MSVATASEGKYKCVDGEPGKGYRAICHGCGAVGPLDILACAACAAAATSGWREFDGHLYCELCRSNAPAISIQREVERRREAFDD